MTEVPPSDDVDFVTSARSTLLSGAEVRSLYGRYNYDVEVPAHLLDQRLVLFYGDNGSGKTTVLRLIWHLLSASNNRGHRTSISKVGFRQISLALSNGDLITASRSDPNPGPYTLEVRRSSDAIVRSEWPSSPTPFGDWTSSQLEAQLAHLPRELALQAEGEIQRRKYIEYLAGLEIRPYFLADDRIIYGDELEDSAARRRDTLARRLAASEGRGPAFSSPDDAQGAVVQELETSLRRASEYLRELTLGGNASGSAGANSVYLEVLRRLGHQSEDGNQLPIDVKDELTDSIRKLGERSKGFEEFQLVPQFDTPNFVDAVSRLADPSRIAAASDMLSPYLNSLSARLDALQGAETLVRTFLNQTNGFLRDKRLTFSPRHGLRIQLLSGESLDAQQLSSGERQLVLLLCNALLARRGTRLFLIDEPELSLNAKWQRSILDALLACTEGTAVQFLVATHSLELLAGYRPNVVRLEEAG